MESIDLNTWLLVPKKKSVSFNVAAREEAKESHA